jgi:L,D-transpeptidase YcbB
VRELAVLLLNDEEKWNQQALEMALSNNKTREINLTTAIPILIDYWTVDVDEDGYISYRPDIYGRDKDVLTALDSPAH